MKKKAIPFIIVFILLIAFGLFKLSQDRKYKTNLSSALKYYLNNDYDNALLCYEKALTIDKKSPEANVGKIQILMLKGDIKKAAEAANSALANNPENSKILVTSSFVAIEKDENELAIERCKTVLKNDPDNNEALTMLYSIYKNNTSLGSADELLKSSAKTSSSLNSFILKALIETKSWDKSLELLKKAYDKDKNDVVIYDALPLLSNNDEFINKLKDQVDKNSKEPMYKLFYLLSTYNKNPDDSLKLAEEIKSSYKDNIQYDIVLSNIYKAKGDNSSSNAIFDNLEKKEKKDYIALYNIAWNYFDKGEYEKALEFAKESIIANPEYKNNYLLLAPNCLFKLGRYEDSIPYFIKVSDGSLLTYFKISNENSSPNDTYSLEENTPLDKKYSTIMRKLQTLGEISPSAQRIFDICDDFYYFSTFKLLTEDFETRYTTLNNSDLETFSKHIINNAWFLSDLGNHIHGLKLMKNVTDILNNTDKNNEPLSFTPLDMAVLSLSEDLYNKVPKERITAVINNCESLKNWSNLQGNTPSEKSFIDDIIKLEQDYSFCKENNLFNVKFNLRNKLILP